ncbi:MAG: tetratricopeptide repeat protein [Pyrinomonadaceae bacterium]|nr:tetratricopeptide repeat protein [Pyrinomonadaceae bacterium]
MRRNTIELFIVNFVFILLLCLSVKGQHQLSKENPNEVKPLAVGQIVEREIVPMQKHRYAIALEAGQFVRIELAETDVDGVMSLRSPDNKNLFEHADIKPVNGVKTNWAAAAVKGVYELRVISYGEVKGKGTYRLKIGEIRLATDEEMNFTAGTKLYNEGFNLVGQVFSTAEILQANLAKGRQALEKFRLAKAVKSEAKTLWQMAVVSSRLGIGAETIELYLASIEKSRSINDRRGEANASRDLADAYSKIGEWDKAIQINSESLKIARDIKLKSTEAGVLNQLGEVYTHFGDFERAALYYQQSSEIYLQFSNISRSVPLNNLGKIALNEGNMEKAADFFRQAVEAVRKEENRFGATK